MKAHREKTNKHTLMEMSPVQKKLVWYTLSRSPQTRSTKLQIDHARLDMYNLVSTAGGGVLLPLLDNHSLEVLALMHLSLDVGNELGKVWCVLVHCQRLVLMVVAVLVHPQPWSTPPWAGAGGTWRAAVD
jgi:hypothetical protein